MHYPSTCGIPPSRCSVSPTRRQVCDARCKTWRAACVNVHCQCPTINSSANRRLPWIRNEVRRSTARYFQFHKEISFNRYRVKRNLLIFAMAKKEEIDKIERELKLAREIIFFSFQGKYIP